MTPSDLIAAAERIKNRVARPGDVDRLVVHVLATVLADDDDPVSLHWFKSEVSNGSRRHELNDMLFLYCHDSAAVVELIADDDSIDGMTIFEATTRGPVRSLLRALGKDVA